MVQILIDSCSYQTVLLLEGLHFSSRKYNFGSGLVYCFWFFCNLFGTRLKANLECYWTRSKLRSSSLLEVLLEKWVTNPEINRNIRPQLDLDWHPDSLATSAEQPIFQFLPLLASLGWISRIGHFERSRQSHPDVWQHHLPELELLPSLSSFGDNKVPLGGSPHWLHNT